MTRKDYQVRRQGRRWAVCVRGGRGVGVQGGFVVRSAAELACARWNREAAEEAEEQALAVVRAEVAARACAVTISTAACVVTIAAAAACLRATVEGAVPPCLGLGGEADPRWVEGHGAAVRELARGLAGMFAADNGRFDRGRFFRACGLDEGGR